jgi:hypothetical protein
MVDTVLWQNLYVGGGREAMCHLNGIEKLSSKISFAVQDPVEILYLKNKNIFGEYSEHTRMLLTVDILLNQNTT